MAVESVSLYAPGAVRAAHRTWQKKCYDAENEKKVLTRKSGAEKYE